MCVCVYVRERDREGEVDYKRRENANFDYRRSLVNEIKRFRDFGIVLSEEQKGKKRAEVVGVSQKTPTS